MIKSVNSNGSETGTEGSEPIDLTRIIYSSGSMSSDKDCNFDNNSINVKKDETSNKKSRFKGKNKIDIEFITKKSRRQSTFSKRKTGLMKKAYELAELTGAEVLLMIASDTNHVYTYGTTKMKPVFESEQGKLLIEACLNSSLNNKAGELVNPGLGDSSNHEFYSEASLAPAINHQSINQSSTTNHIGQIVLNFDNSPFSESKIAFPISISNGVTTGANQNPFSSSVLLTAATSNKDCPDYDSCSDSIILSSTTKPDTAVLVPFSLASLSTTSMLPANN